MAQRRDDGSGWARARHGNEHGDAGDGLGRTHHGKADDDDVFKEVRNDGRDGQRLDVGPERVVVDGEDGQVARVVDALRRRR